MAKSKKTLLTESQQKKLSEARDILHLLGFEARQCNEIAGYTLIALLELLPGQSWNESQCPQRGITPIMSFVGEHYGVRYAPNTRETVRDEAVKHFAEAGLLLRNPDNPARPPNSGKTVYQVEPHALQLIQSYNTRRWKTNLTEYLAGRDRILNELKRRRNLVRIPVALPSGKTVLFSPGGQNPLIKAVIEEFCPRFAPGGTIAYIGDAEDKFLYLEQEYLQGLGIAIPPPSKMPDIVIHYAHRNWLLLIEAVTSAGPIDGKRRKELKELFTGSSAGMIFVTTFSSRQAMRSFLPQISWESEVWVAEDPDHIIHFDGERFLGPYPDVQPKPN
jgi:hypothetical protein